VDDCSLTVEDRQFVVLVGPSGCGKSTTLRMIAGLETITSGEIHIGGRLVNDVAPRDRDIAMVFQNYALYPHMTVYKNMAFALKLRGTPRAEIDRRVGEAAAILGLTDYLDRKPAALSGGQRQRVALGRAIVRQPQVFLFDEPLSNLDARMRVQMRAELARLHRQLRATMIYVTHDQVEAMTLGDRVVVMNEGVVQQVDAPLDLYDRPANRFVAGFIGSPPMNLIEGELASHGRDLHFAAGALRLTLADWQRRALEASGLKRVTLGIRPEHIDVVAGPAPTPGRAAIEGIVDVVEPMGAETYLYFNAGEVQLRARVAPHAPLAPAGAPQPFWLALDHAHWFHPETGRRVPALEAAASSA
jgi:multiple sugar transport system ATP-binding protein